MRFDDRLRTVLAQPAADPHDRAVRWRQLVELAARASPDGDGDLFQQAIEAIRRDADQVDERVRVAAALAIAPLSPPVHLVAAFAADRLNVAAPILAGARLTASEWKHVAAEASEECSAFISTMRSGKPQPGGGSSVPEPPPGENSKPIPSISEVVARIERLRHSREAAESPAAGEEQSAGAARLFRWECNEAGEIEWVEGAPRGALVGQSIAHSGISGGVDRSVERAFASRAPFHDGLLELPRDAAIGGTWKISGVPAFEPSSGRFSGYRGIAERPGGNGQQAERSMAADPASLRELAHEIRTPLNAIIGFAEIISGEHLGPAENHYRQRAADIVAQARLLLSAVEDLDFAARLHSLEQRAQADLSDCLARAWDEVEREAQARGVEVNVAAAERPARCRVDPELSQRLLERFCIAVIGYAREGEKLTFRIGDDCTLSVNRPAALDQVDLHPDRNRRAADTATLPVRLVMGLARTAGGDLDAGGDPLVLRLPRA